VDRQGLTVEQRRQQDEALTAECAEKYARLAEIDAIFSEKLQAAASTGDPLQEGHRKQSLPFKDLLSCQDIEDNLIQEWLESAASLVDTFRTTTALFPSDGKRRFTGLFRPMKKKGQTDVDAQADSMAARLQASMVDDERPADEPDANVELEGYRSITFPDWAKLVVRYAFMLTLVDEREEACEVLRHVQTSSYMKLDESCLQLLTFGLAACAIHHDEYDEAFADIRKLIAAKKSESEPLRLFNAVCSSGLPALSAFLNTKFQKYLLRQIKYIDSKALAAPEGGMMDGDDSPAEDLDVGDMFMTNAFKPTKLNPTFLVLYGHLMAAGKSYQSASVYYLRAYDLRPDDPMICLSLALAYTHRAMQRQADNRHHSLAQAIALLNSYRKLRDNEVEVNYNVARIFHQLGILDLAVKHYEKVLVLADSAKAAADATMDVDAAAKSEGGPPLDLSKEAAYNLSLIYFTRNAPELARSVADKYLRM